MDLDGNALELQGDLYHYSNPTMNSHSGSWNILVISFSNDNWNRNVGVLFRQSSGDLAFFRAYIFRWDSSMDSLGSISLGSRHSPRSTVIAGCMST